jgi:serine phosphatase RsbU (regulator of sigma subunit)
MEIQIAVAKTTRFGSEESGDSIEVIERPNGGLSVVMCDGQDTGLDAKSISGMVVRKVLGLLADGIRDGAAARAANDFLFTERHGQSPCYLNILSADLQSNTLVLTRNNPTSVFVARNNRLECLGGSSEPIGKERNVRPSITEIALQANTTVVMYTDGVTNAGIANGNLGMDICTMIEALLDEQEPTAQTIADALLAQAVRLDHQRPNDDMTVVVLRIVRYEVDPIRRLNVRMPFNLPMYSSLMD